MSPEMESTDYTLGSHASTLRMLVEGQARMEASIEEIKKTISETKGERRVLMWMIGTAGTIASIIMTFILQRGH